MNLKVGFQIQKNLKNLKKKLTDLNFSITNLTGLDYNPIFQQWKKSNNVSVNYIISAKKN